MLRWKRTGEAVPATGGKGFLTRLARDTRGNTLAIVGAALVPLAAMIGSGVDMSRAYMAKTRLQSACDAAALAGRRVMQDDTMTNAVRDEAIRYFNFNFPKQPANAQGIVLGPYETVEVTPTVTRPVSGTVRVTASTRIPTTIMSMFGFEDLPLNVTCDASLNFVNTDIMLVLDVTGSMLCTPEESGSCGRTTEIAQSRIVALRDAVMALYDELEPVQTQLEANGLRMRFGIVPFSSTVNVGHLITAVNPDYVSDHVEYQSRVANYNTPVFIGTPGVPEPPVTQIYGSSISQPNCDKYGQNQNFSGFTASPATGGGPSPSPTWSRTFSNNEAQGVDWGWPGSDTSGNTRSCRRRYVETDTTYETRFRFTSFSYEPESIDVSNVKIGQPVSIATNTGGTAAVAGLYDPLEVATTANGEGATALTTTPLDWSGCIEERQTVSTITSASGTDIPAGAHDLNIDLIPSDDDTRWRPHLPSIVYRRTAGSASALTGTQMSSLAASYSACPAEARRLQAWTETALQSYINGLAAVGGTYHDVGMIWGARMISPGGIFADSPGTFAGMPVSRHIIYMTDGQLSTNNDTYTAYGIEQNDERVTGVHNSSTSDRNSRHIQRFRMLCTAAKSMGVSVWVLAFSTPAESSMSDCASNSNQFSLSTSRDELIARFRQIGNQIGALRLTQ